MLFRSLPGETMGREATLYLTSRGVRVAGIDAWGWDAPFVHTVKRWLETRDPSIIWEGHKAGREIPYCHMRRRPPRASQEDVNAPR